MSSQEYRELLAKQAAKNKELGNAEADAAEAPLAQAIRWGDRLAKWLEFENARRSPSQALRLTSAGTRGGIPIDKPSVYSIKTVGENNTTLARELPAEMVAVLNGADFPAALPGGSDEEFV